MNALLVAAIVALLHLTRNGVAGRWKTKLSEKGTVTSVLINPDNIFEDYINKKPFTSGTYALQFEANSDSCTVRKGGMLRLIK